MISSDFFYLSGSLLGSLLCLRSFRVTDSFDEYTPVNSAITPTLNFTSNYLGDAKKAFFQITYELQNSFYSQTYVFIVFHSVFFLTMCSVASQGKIVLSPQVLSNAFYCCPFNFNAHVLSFNDRTWISRDLIHNI